jgi:hypothetical protein
LAPHGSGVSLTGTVVQLRRLLEQALTHLNAASDDHHTST